MNKNDKAERLIARMILGVGLSIAVAGSAYCATIHDDMADIMQSYDTAIINKRNYLDDYEKRDEYKLAYDMDVKKLNERLIAREINGATYDKELAEMQSNAYTEQVFMETASEQMKKTYNLIDQEFVNAKTKKEDVGLHFLISSYGVIGGLVLGVGGYALWNPKKKKRNFIIDDSTEHHISNESIKKVMELEDVPYQGDDYIPNVPRSVDACIIKTNGQENQNNL